AEELVAAEGHDVHASAQALRHRRLVEAGEGGEEPAAQVFDHGHARLPGQGDELGARGRLRVADDAEVAGVDLQDEAGVRAQGRAIVRDARAVRGADLAQARTPLAQDVRNT